MWCTQAPTPTHGPLAFNFTSVSGGWRRGGHYPLWALPAQVPCFWTAVQSSVPVWCFRQPLFLSIQWPRVILSAGQHLQSIVNGVGSLFWQGTPQSSSFMTHQRGFICKPPISSHPQIKQECQSPCFEITPPPGRFSCQPLPPGITWQWPLTVLFLLLHHLHSALPQAYPCILSRNGCSNAVLWTVSTLDVTVSLRQTNSSPCRGVSGTWQRCFFEGQDWRVEFFFSFF